MFNTRTFFLAAVGLVTAAGTAMAQDPPKAACPVPVEEGAACPAPEPAPAPQPTTEAQPLPPADMTPVHVAETHEHSTLERYGVALSLGGGVTGFTDNIMRDTTQDGGGWDVRATVGTRSIVALEGEYIGSAQSIDALGLDNNAILVGNGLNGNVRVNILDMNFQPFLFAGVGWRHYNLTNESTPNLSDVQNSDDVIEFPMGGGIAWKYNGLMLDARGEYRYSGYEDMVPDLRVGQTDGASMHRYGVNLNVGFAY